MLIAYEAGDGVVVMTNSDNGLALVSDLVRTVAHEYGWPDYQPAMRTVNAIEPRVFDRYVGAYRLPSGQVVTFWRDGSVLNSRIWGDPPSATLPILGARVFRQDIGTALGFFGCVGDGCR